MASKQPSAGGRVSAGRQVPNISSREGGKLPAQGRPTDRDAQLRFRFDMLDHQQWPLHGISKSDHKRMLIRLKYLESLTLAQALSQKIIGDYDMSECPNKSARTRLANEYEGLDSLTKIVVEPSGAMRLFARRIGAELHLIWWDPKHDVWPEGKQRR